MSVVIMKGGKVTNTSKNLRGIIEHARRVGAPRNVEIKSAVPFSNASPYDVVFRFPDESTGVAEFADASVARDWVKARRSWGDVPVSQRVY